MAPAVAAVAGPCIKKKIHAWPAGHKWRGAGGDP